MLQPNILFDAGSRKNTRYHDQAWVIIAIDPEWFMWPIDKFSAKLLVPAMIKLRQLTNGWKLSNKLMELPKGSDAINRCFRNVAMRLISGHLKAPSDFSGHKLYDNRFYDIAADNFIGTYVVHALRFDVHTGYREGMEYAV